MTGPGHRRTSHGTQGSIRRYSDERTLSRLIFTGPAIAAQRAGLTVRVSYDEGKSWRIGREVTPGDDDQPTGYSSAALGPDGIGGLFERCSGAQTDPCDHRSVYFNWYSLGAVLCGRTEPILIGGNSWMGTYYRVLRNDDGQDTYRGRAVIDGQMGEVEVRTQLATMAQPSMTELGTRTVI